MAEALESEDGRPTVLLFFRYFSPQYEASGPTQSLCRMVAALGERYRFRVICIAQPGEPENQWGEAFGVERFTTSNGIRGLFRQWRLIRQLRFDLAIFNSFFDPQLTTAMLVMRKLRLIPDRPMLVAPRGEFSGGALALKPRRKQASLRLARLFGLVKDVQFQATGPLEQAAIRQLLPNAGPILIGPNIRAVEPLPAHRPRSPGSALRVAFLSRIDAKKNVHLALNFIRASGVPVHFDIIGPITDPNYWSKCQALIEQMPPTIRVRYLESVRSSQVVPTLAEYDLMLFPTAGENYGHAIVDSLVAGTPVLVSDQTPWLDLAEARAGVDLPLNDEQQWLDWVRRFSAMSQVELDQWRAGARAFAEASIDTRRDIEITARCLDTALGRTA